MKAAVEMKRSRSLSSPPAEQHGPWQGVILNINVVHVLTSPPPPPPPPLHSDHAPLLYFCLIFRKQDQLPAASGVAVPPGGSGGSDREETPSL
ncbi:unnamed protein product [Merluccius merluccius]